MLAKAIAAEKLIQVFHTHGGKIEGSDIAKDIVATVAEDGEGSEAAAEKLREAYRKVSKTQIINSISQYFNASRKNGNYLQCQTVTAIIIQLGMTFWLLSPQTV